jgi:hypothetical protein
MTVSDFEKFKSNEVLFCGEYLRIIKKIKLIGTKKSQMNEASINEISYNNREILEGKILTTAEIKILRRKTFRFKLFSIIEGGFYPWVRNIHYQKGHHLSIDSNGKSIIFINNQRYVY